jgi:hypothetical protein
MDLSGWAKAVGGEPRLPYRSERRPTEPQPTVAAPQSHVYWRRHPRRRQLFLRAEGRCAGAQQRCAEAQGRCAEAQGRCAGAEGQRRTRMQNSSLPGISFRNSTSESSEAQRCCARRGR